MNYNASIVGETSSILEEICAGYDEEMLHKISRVTGHQRKPDAMQTIASATVAMQAFYNIVCILNPSYLMQQTTQIYGLSMFHPCY